MQIDLRNIVAKYGEQTVLRDVSLTVPEGELWALLGPSGSGKTTLLFIVAGFRRPEAGTLQLGNRDALWLHPRDRQIGMVFQDLALWPHMTVEKHLDFVLKSRGLEREERRKRIAEILDIVELAPMAGKVPSTLSGGEAQRLALARALVTRPKILLLDEPLGALDRRLREKMLVLIREAHTKFRTTTIYVTHDYDEALGLADRVAVVHEGKLQQIGTPDDVYHRPANARVAEIGGVVSVVEGEREGDGVRLPWGVYLAHFAGKADGGVLVALRPEQVEVRAGGDAVVRSCRFRSGRWEVDVETGGAVVTGWSRKRLEAGSGVSVDVSEPVWAFGKEGGA